MDSIFTLNDDQTISDKINLDDLYETKRQHDMDKLHIYNKLLSLV